VNADRVHPSITVLKTRGFNQQSSSTTTEIYDDLGVLWNCWVWRGHSLSSAHHRHSHDDEDDDDEDGDEDECYLENGGVGSSSNNNNNSELSEVGLLFQLPCTDSEKGVLNLEALVVDDEKRNAMEREEQLLAEIKRAEISNA
jgi:hypothetical protein